MFTKKGLNFITIFLIIILVSIINIAFAQSVDPENFWEVFWAVSGMIVIILLPVMRIISFSAIIFLLLILSFYFFKKIKFKKTINYSHNIDIQKETEILKDKIKNQLKILFIIFGSALFSILSIEIVLMYPFLLFLLLFPPLFLLLLIIFIFYKLFKFCFHRNK